MLQQSVGKKSSLQLLGQLQLQWQNHLTLVLLDSIS